MKRKLLLFISTVLISSFGIAQTNTTCNPNSANYNTGSSDGSAFTQTSLIRTQSSDAERGWARFNTTAIPDGDDINSVELHIYVSEDNYAYFDVMSIESDPLLGTAASVFTDCGDGTQYANYNSNFPDPGWYVVDLGAQAATDLQALLTDDWFGVGLYEYEGYGSYYLEYDGWNDANPPYIIVSHNPPPACPDPTAQIETNLTATGADLGWTDGSGSNWDLYIVTSGSAAPIQNTTPTANDVTANPYTWSGGSANTTYDWYVRSDCDQDNSGTSAWVGPSTFTTTATPTTIPFTQDFEGNSFGTHISPLSGDQSDIFINTASANAGTYGVQMEGKTSTGWSGGATSTTETQAWNDNASHISSMNIVVDATAATAVLLSFDLKQTYSYGVNYSWFRIVVNGTQIGSSYNPSSQNGDAFQTLMIDLNAYAGTTFTLSLQHSGKYNNANGSGTPGGDNAYVDNISITAPSCPIPSTQVETNVTATSVDLGWTTGGSSNWEIEYDELGFSQGSGTTIFTSSNPQNVTGLTGGTTYSWYVRDICGAGDTSDWIGPHSFTTDCPAKVTTFPYTTDFENAGSIANCWTNDPTDAGGDWEFTQSNSRGSSSDHTSGSGYYALLNDFSVTTSNSPFNLLTPIFDLSTHNKWYKVSYWAWIGPDGASNPIYFEVSLDGGTTWETLYTHDHSTTGSWFNVSIDLGFKKSDNVVFRFKGVSVWGYNTDNSGIDDFTIEETQAPPVPLSDWAIYIGIFFILLFMVVAYKRRLA